MNHKFSVTLTLFLCTAALTACAAGQTRLGGGGTMATGSAGAAGSQGASTKLAHCSRPIGTAALVEPKTNYYSRYGLTSPVSLLRLMMAQSNCFTVVDRGAALKAMEYERNLAEEGELARGSAMGRGQMVTAEFVITPKIVHKDEDAGGGAAGLAAFLPGVVGAVAGGLKTSNLEAQTILFLTNVRTGVQEAVATGSATKRDIDWGVGGFAGVIGAAGGGYADTEVGKIVAAAFLDAHNKLVAQLQATQPTATRDVGGGYVTATDLNLRGGPSSDAPVFATIPAGTPLTLTGQEYGQWWQVEVSGMTGWMHSDYITR